ncbi:MFS family permease [Bacillus tianshenii]|uniref:MFS family permease n=1 Tax=Sutcliffiella tianshenii TaxID=1463404 RepID=A0ABS2P192_9BACI|nr:MFS transporter [Bacillus tianshenii]MBM7620707.1 MFS family permease [Bacillus tianshenii]
MNSAKGNYLSATLLTIMGLLVVCNLYTLIPLYQPISLEWQIPESQAVLASSFFSIFYAIGLLTFGPLSEKLGRKNVLMYGMLFSACATLFVSFAGNIHYLYGFRSLQGFALGCFAPVAFAYCFDHYTENLRTMTISFINAAFLLAGIAGPLVSEWLEYSYRWQTVFIVFGFLYAITFVLCAVILRHSMSGAASQSKIWQPFFYLLSDRKLLTCYLIVFSLLLSFVAFYDSLYQYLLLTYPEQPFILVRSIGLIGVVSCFFSNSLQKRLKVPSLLLCCSIAIILSFALILIHPVPIVISLASILFVAAISIYLPSIISYVGMLGAQYRASAISLYSFTLLSGTSFGPIISHAFSFAMTLLILSCWFMINILLLYWIKRKTLE